MLAGGDPAVPTGHVVEVDFGRSTDDFAGSTDDFGGSTGGFVLSRLSLGPPELAELEPELLLVPEPELDCELVAPTSPPHPTPTTAARVAMSALKRNVRIPLRTSMSRSEARRAPLGRLTQARESLGLREIRSRRDVP
jgi:hypothetical protein